MFDVQKNIALNYARSVRGVLRGARARVLGMIDEMDGVVARAETIHGWTAGVEAREMALASYDLVGDPTIVEIGVFMGRSTVLLAAPRVLRGSGKVHSVDAFDCSGDEYSVPHYINELKLTGFDSLEAVFRHNIAQMNLGRWVEIHKGTSLAVASAWTRPIDLLLLDGDQTAQGAREAYESWSPFLKKGGLIILTNSGDREHAVGHDGNRRIAIELVTSPRYTNIRRLANMTFAVKEN